MPDGSITTANHGGNKLVYYRNPTTLSATAEKSRRRIASSSEILTTLGPSYSVYLQSPGLFDIAGVELQASWLLSASSNNSIMA